MPKRMLPGHVVATLLLLSFPVLAQSHSKAQPQGDSRTQPQSDPKLQGYLLSVKRLYEALEYEQALGQVVRAKRYARTVYDDVILSLYEGIILADLNRWEDSAAAFKAALFLMPGAPLPLEVSPKVREHFETVREEVRREIADATPSNPPPPPEPSSQSTTSLPTTTREPGTENPHEGKAPLTRTEHAPVAADAFATAPAETGGRSLTSPQVLIPAIGGGVLLAAGGTSWALSRRELSRLRNADTSLATREDIRRSASRGSTLQTVGVGLLGAGVVGVGIATGLFIAAPARNEVRLGMGTDGTSAFVHGRWP